MGKFSGPSYVDVMLEDNPTSTLCYHLTVEIVKYILYQKAQIPLPLDNLQRQADVFEKYMNDEDATKILSSGQTESSHSQWKQKAIFIKKNKTQQRFQRYWRQFYEKWTSVTEVLEDQFHYHAPSASKEVAVLLGATILSPKDAFVLQFPACSSSVEAPLRRNLPSVFRALLSSEEVEKSLRATVGLTNIHVLLNHSSPQTLLDESRLTMRFDYTIPKRGRQIIIRFGVKPTITSDSLLLSPDTTEEEIQDEIMEINRGFRNLKVKQCLFGPETEVRLRSELDISGIAILDSSQEIMEVEASTLACQEIWYQVLPTLKGFKHTMS